ncbi:laminin subunit alpha [Caerostris extrusa]|uniref:Laminin subunit alpha n=1 Tax=Caerostris extrusa TaxID=172846 RepID=A0AAV4TUF9_CAEEX|nr:laminin subunit alpha [Caerostris extrusa]
MLGRFGTGVKGTVLNPPYFNIAENRKITSTATCGEGVTEPEDCIVAGGGQRSTGEPQCEDVIFGQSCDFCDPDDPKRAHPPQNAIDGTENWWQSPPAGRGNKYNEVNLTIHLGQVSVVILGFL